MYLKKSFEWRGAPGLDLFTHAKNEPPLLQHWFDKTPFTVMNEVYLLDRDLYYKWREHFETKVLSRIFFDATEREDGTLIAGHVPISSLTDSQEKWANWISSSNEPSLFESTTLERIIHQGATPVEALMLTEDISCSGCLLSEPAFLYANDFGEFPRNVSRLKQVYERNLFPDLESLSECPHCVDIVVPERFNNFSRNTSRRCQCMPCSRRL